MVPATENMPSGHADQARDIITQLNGKTVEVNNTDAEGRLILADALAYAVELGAERIVDLATLTGAVLIALGSTYAALISNDDDLAAEVEGAAERTGELAWRLPLHPEYKELTKGTAADLTNASAKRKAGTIYAGSFLEEFVGERPWVHLDIAGTAWDVGREYAGKGPTGYGVRLLVELVHARRPARARRPAGASPAAPAPCRRRRARGGWRAAPAPRPLPGAGPGPRPAAHGALGPSRSGRCRGGARRSPGRASEVAVLDHDRLRPKADPCGREVLAEAEDDASAHPRGQPGSRAIPRSISPRMLGAMPSSTMRPSRTRGASLRPLDGAILRS